ncbi:MAG: hypothetical protein U5K56_02920 [Halioglobus sp.]|nr:hypothetical protein [Halioglobus sp.]
MSNQPDIHRMAAPDTGGIRIDLNRAGRCRVEIPVWKIRAYHDEQVALVHRLDGGLAAEQTEAAGTKRMIVVDHLLGLETADDGRLNRIGKGQQLGPDTPRSRCRRESRYARTARSARPRRRSPL